MSATPTASAATPPSAWNRRENHYITVTSVIMDLDAKTLLLTDGVPCENEYQTVTL